MSKYETRDIAIDFSEVDPNSWDLLPWLKKASLFSKPIFERVSPKLYITILLLVSKCALIADYKESGPRVLAAWSSTLSFAVLMALLFLLETISNIVSLVHYGIKAFPDPYTEVYMYVIHLFHHAIHIALLVESHRTAAHEKALSSTGIMLCGVAIGATVVLLVFRVYNYFVRLYAFEAVYNKALKTDARDFDLMRVVVWGKQVLMVIEEYNEVCKELLNTENARSALDRDDTNIERYERLNQIIISKALEALEDGRRPR